MLHSNIYNIAQLSQLQWIFFCAWGTSRLKFFVIASVTQIELDGNENYDDDTCIISGMCTLAIDNWPPWK